MTSKLKKKNPSKGARVSATNCNSKCLRARWWRQTVLVWIYECAWWPISLIEQSLQSSTDRVQQRVRAHPQYIANRNVCEGVGLVELFVFEFMNVHSDSFLLAKTDFKVEQVGSNKEWAHICKTLQLKMFTSAFASSNCSCLNLSMCIVTHFS